MLKIKNYLYNFKKCMDNLTDLSGQLRKKKRKQVTKWPLNTR